MVGVIVSSTDHSDFEFKNALRVLFHQCLAVRPLSGALQAQIRAYLIGTRPLAAKSLTEAPLLSTSARSVGVYGFCCASISTLVHIYPLRSTHSQSLLLSWWAIDNSKLALKVGYTGRQIRFARLCLKLYLLKIYRSYKAEPGIFPGVDILRLC